MVGPIVREIQDDTHGFSEFIPMSYIHTNTPLYTQGIGRAGATGREDLLMIAVSRLFLDNFTNVQVSWGKLGLKMTQLALLCGGNDLAGTMFTDEVSVDAGAGDAMESAYRAKLSGELASGECKSWVIEMEKAIVASGAISIVKMVPTPFDISCRMAYVHSMYTEKEQRGCGCASKANRWQTPGSCPWGSSRSRCCW